MCPWSLSAETEQQILAARAKTGWGEMRLSVLCGGRHRSSIGKVLRRHGVSRLPKSPRRSSRRYEWAEAGALLHFDALRLPKFDRPGHASASGPHAARVVLTGHPRRIYSVSSSASGACPGPQYVDFSPTHEFQRVLDHLTGTAAPADA
jgi:hypothetical protein